jgi:hypothetical protein
LPGLLRRNFPNRLVIYGRWNLDKDFTVANRACSIDGPILDAAVCVIAESSGMVTVERNVLLPIIPDSLEHNTLPKSGIVFSYICGDGFGGRACADHPYAGG